MGYIAIIIGAVLSALNFPFLKSALNTFTPYSLLAIRMIISSLIYSFIYLKFFKEDLSWKQTKMLMFLSFSLFCGLTFIVCGLEKTTVTSTHAITTLAPILTTIGAATLLHEKIKKRQYIGFLIGFVGLSLLTLNPLLSNGTHIGSLKGNVLVALSTICTATYLLYSKKVTEVMSPYTALFGTLLGCSLLFTITTVISVLYGNPLITDTLGLNNIFQLGYLVVFGTILGFFLYQYGVKHASSFFGGLGTYIQFPVVILLGVFYYKEVLTPLFIVGVILSILGALVAIDYKKEAYR